MDGMAYEFERKQRIAVLGGGPGGYEAAIAGAQLGADVTLIERSGVGIFIWGNWLDEGSFEATLAFNNLSNPR